MAKNLYICKMTKLEFLVYIQKPKICHPNRQTTSTQIKLEIGKRNVLFHIGVENLDYKNVLWFVEGIEEEGTNF